MQVNHLIGCFLISATPPETLPTPKVGAKLLITSWPSFPLGYGGRSVPSSCTTYPDWLSLTFLTRSTLGSLFWHLNASRFSSYTHWHSPRRDEPGTAQALWCLSPIPAKGNNTRRQRPRARTRTTPCWHVLKQASRGNAPKQAPRFGRRAQPDAPEGRPARARSPRFLPALPPTKVGGPTPAPPSQGALALPLHRYLLPGAASPTHHPGLRGRRRRLVPRLSHEAPREPRFALPPPRPPALRPHPRLWSRGGRQRGSTFAALAAPGDASLLSSTRSASFFRDPLSPQKTPSASRGHRVGPHRFGPDSDSKMAPGARGRALSPARLRRRGRERAAPGGSAHRRCSWGPRPPGSRTVGRLPPPDATATFRGFFVLKPVWEGWSSLGG